MLNFKGWLEDFAKVSGGVKNQWINIDSSNIDKEIAEELFDLIAKTYGYAGGYTGISSADDLLQAIKSDQIALIKAIDVDEVLDADAFNAYKLRPSGRKFTISASKPKTKMAFADIISNLNVPGYYAEASGKSALLLLKNRIPVIENESTVRCILQKPIEWHGEYPNISTLPSNVAKIFGKYKGWYDRELGGQIITKIIVGIPKGC